MGLAIDARDGGRGFVTAEIMGSTIEGRDLVAAETMGLTTGIPSTTAEGRAEITGPTTGTLSTTDATELAAEGRAETIGPTTGMSPTTDAIGSCGEEDLVPPERMGPTTGISLAPTIDGKGAGRGLSIPPRVSRLSLIDRRRKRKVISSSSCLHIPI